MFTEKNGDTGSLFLGLLQGGGTDGVVEGKDEGQSLCRTCNAIRGAGK